MTKRAIAVLRMLIINSFNPELSELLKLDYHLCTLWYLNYYQDEQSEDLDRIKDYCPNIYMEIVNFHFE